MARSILFLLVGDVIERMQSQNNALKMAVQERTEVMPQLARRTQQYPDRLSDELWERAQECFRAIDVGCEYQIPYSKVVHAAA